jgi:hypothetical protein
MDKIGLMRADEAGAASGNSALSIRPAALPGSSPFMRAGALTRRRRSAVKRLRFVDQGLRLFRVC